MGENQLRKELKLTNLITMAAGGMIAAWMVEIKYWFEVSGPGSLFALLTCALLVLPLCFIYSEMTSMLPYAGGENIWISNAFGWHVGFFSFWFIMLLYIMAMPTVAYGIASMVGYWVPLEGTTLKIIATIILVLWFFLTNLELKILAQLQSILFWSTLTISVSASIIFILSGNWHYENITPWFTNGGSGYSAAVGLLIMKFVGFDLIPQLSEEANFPKKDLWKAFLGSLGCTLLIYGMAIIGVSGIVSNEWIADTNIVDPKVADIIGLHWLAILIVVMGIATCLTTLSSFWLSASRVLYGAAKQGQVTKKFMKLNKNGQPVFANIIVGILSIYFTVLAPEAWINYIYTIYGLAAGIVYLLVVLSFFKLRKDHPEWKRPYKVKAAMFLTIVGIGFTVWVIYSSYMAMNIGGWKAIGLYTMLLVPVILFAKVRQKSDPENWKVIITSPDNEEVE